MDDPSRQGLEMKPYYEEPGITIYHGKCRDYLFTLTDLLLTDPPYGIKMDKGFEGFEGFGGFGKPIARRQYPDSWDDKRPDKDTFAHCLDCCKRAIIFGGNFFADLLPVSTHWIVWDKLNTMPTFGDCELAWTNIDRKSVKKVTVEWNGLLGKEWETRKHPTQKPLKLMNWCIENYSEPGETILDPFMGSGTTLRAAKDLGRKAIGIEIEEKYCEIAVKRLQQEVLPLI
jgi:DNA modification methylase